MSIIVITGFQAIYINKPNCAGAFLFPEPINDLIKCPSVSGSCQGICTADFLQFIFLIFNIFSQIFQSICQGF